MSRELFGLDEDGGIRVDSAILDTPGYQRQIEGARILAQIAKEPAHGANQTKLLEKYMNTMPFQKWIRRAIDLLFEEGHASDATKLMQVRLAMESLIRADLEYDASKAGMYMAEGKPVYRLCVSRYEDACYARKALLDHLKLEVKEAGKGHDS